MQGCKVEPYCCNCAYYEQVVHCESVIIWNFNFRNKDLVPIFKKKFAKYVSNFYRSLLSKLLSYFFSHINFRAYFRLSYFFSSNINHLTIFCWYIASAKFAIDIFKPFSTTFDNFYIKSSRCKFVHTKNDETTSTRASENLARWQENCHNG